MIGRHPLRWIVPTAVMMLTAPVQAQDRDADIAALKRELEQARATIAGLEQRLEALANPPATPTPEESVRTVDLTQQASDPTPTPASTPALSVAGWELAPPGPINRPLAPPAAGVAAAFELAAGSGAGRASFTLTGSRDDDTGPPRNGATTAINDTVGVTFSAPLAKEGDTPFATLDGLAKGTKLELTFTRFESHIPTQRSDDEHPLLRQARKDCRERKPAYQPGCVRVDQAFLDEFMKDKRDQQQYKRDYARASLGQSSGWSLRAALGYDEFTVYPAPTLAKATVERVLFSAGGSLIFFPWRRTSLAIDIDANRSFEADDAAITCPVPAAGATIVSCVPGPIAGPKRVDRLILAPEIRHLIHLSDDGLIRDLGVGPRLETDLLTGDLAFDAPVYFAADEKSGLIGGARIGYLTGKDDVRFSLFVGKAFSLFR